MAWADSNYIQLPELYTAYRKAKSEAFFDTNCAHGLKFAAYEVDLSANLRRLLQMLNRENPAWQSKLSFIGRATLIPKSVDPPKSDPRDSEALHCESSEPLNQWRKLCAEKGKARAEFRPVIDATVDYMIVSALWILKVGHGYDAELDTRHAMGSRLRRWRPDPDSPPGVPGDLNRLAPNLFVPYFVAYGTWRNRGLRVIKSELRTGYRIASITMDLKRFYHRINANFLLNPAFLSGMDVPLTADDRKFTLLLIDSFDTWNRSAADQYGCRPTGVPVGLTASSVIANVLMLDFDRAVTTLSPRYYGRYVDDVILVLRQQDEFEDGEAFVRDLAERLSPIIEFMDNSPDGKALRVDLPYHESDPESPLVFATNKQKVFQLNGEHGLDLINPIEEQIQIQSSEFRDLPGLPRTERGMARRALLVSSDAQLQADALRKADAVTLRRSGFALLLTDVEAHARDVEPDSWKEVRDHYYGLIERHLLAPITFFDLSRYLPRIFSVMIECEDWDRADVLLQNMDDLFGVIQETCTGHSTSLVTELREFRLNLGKRFAEAVFQNRVVSNVSLRNLFKRLRLVFGIPASRPYDLSSLRAHSDALLHTDWSKQSYSNHWIHSSPPSLVAGPRPRTPAIREVLNFEAIDLFTERGVLPIPRWKPLAFPTRPTPVAEISTRAPVLLRTPKEFSAVVRGLRGVWMADSPGFLFYGDPVWKQGPDRFFLPFDLHQNPRIALTNLKVTDNQWSRAASGNPDLSLDRYRDLHGLLNRLTKSVPKPDYILLPELAIPRKWIHSLLKKVLPRGISIVGGLEYGSDPNDPNGLRNEALIALRSDYPGYPTNFVVLQQKREPAWGERSELENKYGKQLTAISPDSPDRPVFIHGGFCFGVLICSELTDIQNRLRFQGQVDALFVPEWNQDVDTFSVLVESAALDVHAFIAQANNRKYGDTRLRGPMKDRFNRDLSRIKGGENDYFVISEMDYRALRKFQATYPPPKDSDDFKPYPIGFQARLSFERRQLP